MVHEYDLRFACLFALRAGIVRFLSRESFERRSFTRLPDLLRFFSALGQLIVKLLAGDPVVVSPDATPLLMTSGNQGFSTGCLCPSQNFQVCDLGLPANAKDGPWTVHVELLKQFQESSVGYASIVSI